MFAIDTNVVVRFLTQDDPEQWAKANALIAREALFVSLTVMLEAEWVLRSVYHFSAARVARALAAFGGLPNVAVQNAPALATALVWAEQGMDFADALHLAQAAECEAFVTFDGRLSKAAKRAGAMKTREP